MRMKAIISVSVLFAMMTLVLFGGCETKVNEDFTGYVQHPFGDADHYDAFRAGTGSFDDCRSCHGDDLRGDGDDGKDCQRCHNGDAGGHVWADAALLGGHQNYIADGVGEITECAICHGAELNGTDSDGPTLGGSCFTCHPGAEHVPGVSSDDFQHKDYLETTSYDFTECTPCHGEDFNGTLLATACTLCHTATTHMGRFFGEGLEKHGEYVNDNNIDIAECAICHGEGLEGSEFAKACSDCHSSENHPFGMTEPYGDHTRYMAENRTPLADCVPCHAADFSGTDLAPNGCNGCHSNPGGPGACNTCHGDGTDDNLNVAPPNDVIGNSQTLYVTVGAHQSHLNTALTTNLACTSCHIVPETWDADGHIDDDDPAELILAGFDDEEAVWDRDAATCSNAACHRTSIPVWTTVDGTWADCATCHEVQLAGHMGADEIGDCATCHGSVVDNTGAIINADLHINGEIDRNQQ